MHYDDAFYKYKNLIIIFIQVTDDFFSQVVCIQEIETKMERKFLFSVLENISKIQLELW